MCTVKYTCYDVFLCTCRYMVRRCRFLENCPGLQLNDGTGPPIVDENGKNTGKYTDISKLRSTLLRKMLEEVKKFCNRDMVKSWNQQSHQQVIHSKKPAMRFLRALTAFYHCLLLFSEAYI